MMAAAVPRADAKEPADRRRAVLYLDCTGTYLFDAQTGVQRVVRNVVRHGLEEGRRRGRDVVPCFFEDGRYYIAPTTSEGRLESRYTANDESSRWFRAKGAYWSAIHGIAAWVRHDGFRNWLVAPASRHGLARQLRCALSALGVFPGPASGAGRPAISFSAGDVLLVLDVAGAEGWDALLTRLRNDGVRLAVIVHDLIPIRHPEGLPRRFLDAFRAWVDTACRRFELIVGISETVVADVRRYLDEAPGTRGNPLPALTSFRPGHELDRAAGGEPMRSELLTIFSSAGADPVYLSVGWIDLRKNQVLVAEALRLLAARGVSSRWVVVGKRGPTTDAVLRRIDTVPELAGRVHVFHDLSDAELDYCYRNASALIFPSTVEGFGLPMVEAMACGLRVFASDIEVFREVGAGFAVHFPLDRTDVLAAQLESHWRHGAFPALRSLHEFHWPDWAASTRQLIDTVDARFAKVAT